MQGSRVIVALAVTAMFAVCATARADLPDPVSTVTADTWVVPGSSTPHGSDTALHVSSLGAATYVRFHVTDLPIPPQRALLRLKVSGGLAQSTTVATTATQWDEATMIAATAPPAGTQVATAGAVGAGQYAEYDVTAAISAPGDYAFRIAGSLPLDAELAARESATAPELTLTTKTPAQELAYRLSTPDKATATRYGAKDTAGATLDGLKIVADTANGGYIGVWHALVDGHFIARAGTSPDLLTWQRRADLDSDASQPTIRLLENGGVLVIEEVGLHPDIHLRFQRYASIAALLAAQPEATFNAPRLLAPSAEGTPSIRAVNDDASQIDVGFHYLRNVDVDRQALGHLTDFTSWTAEPDVPVNTLFEGMGVAGNLGDRDHVRFRGKAFTLYEGQATKGDFSTWREYLYDTDTKLAVKLAIATAQGSPAQGNGTATVLLSPEGKLALAATYFVFSEGAPQGSTEAGELIFYSEYDDGPVPEDEPPPTTVTAPAPPPVTTPPPVATPPPVTTPTPVTPPADLRALRATVLAALDAVSVPTVHGRRLLAGRRYRFDAALPRGSVVWELWSRRPPATTRATTAPRVVVATQARRLGIAKRVRYGLKLTRAGRGVLRRMLRTNRSLVLRAMFTTPEGARVTDDRRVALRP